MWPKVPLVSRPMPCFYRYSHSFKPPPPLQACTPHDLSNFPPFPLSNPAAHQNAALSSKLGKVQSLRDKDAVQTWAFLMLCDKTTHVVFSKCLAASFFPSASGDFDPLLPSLPPWWPLVMLPAAWRGFVGVPTELFAVCIMTSASAAVSLHVESLCVSVCVSCLFCGLHPYSMLFTGSTQSSHPIAQPPPLRVLNEGTNTAVIVVHYKSDMLQDLLCLCFCSSVLLCKAIMV